MHFSYQLHSLMFVYHKKILSTCRIVVADREIGWTLGSVILLIGVRVFTSVFANGLLVVLYLFLSTTYCYYLYEDRTQLDI
jgi:uncharacterized membrane protein YdfJ with MMPL/SSD domain